MEEATAMIMAAIDIGRGSFVNLLTRFGARYQGFIFRIDSPELTIALTYVRCFGTEGRRMDGHEYSGIEEIYKWIIFRGSEVTELQFLPLPLTQIGFVPNSLPGYITQSSPSIALPVEYLSWDAPYAGPSNFAGQHNSSLQPVAIHSSSGQFATLESGSKPLRSWCTGEATDQNLKDEAKTASWPVSLQTKQPWVSAVLPSQSFQAAEASSSAPRPSLPAKDSMEQSKNSAAKTTIGLPPRPQLRRGQGEQRTAVSEGSSARGRGSMAFGRGRGRQIWTRVPNRK